MLKTTIAFALRRFVLVCSLSILVSLVLAGYVIRNKADLLNRNQHASLANPPKSSKRKIEIPEKYLQNVSNISPHNYKYILNAKGGLLCQRDMEVFDDQGRRQSGRLLLLYMVHSKADHFEYRKTIRETWAAYGTRLTKLIFLLGDPRNATLQRQLEEESKLFEDIVQEDFYETYRNITLKNIQGLKWASTFCPQAQYVLKADDDMFINTPLLINSLIKSKLPKKRLILCKIHFFKNVPRSGKYAINSSMYAPDRWPEFCFGGCWVTSRDVVKSFYDVSLNTRQIYLDDVYVTGILRTKLGMDLSYLSRSYNMFCHTRGNYTAVRAMWNFSRKHANKQDSHYVKTWSTCFS